MTDPSLPTTPSESGPPARRLWLLWQAGDQPDVHDFLAQGPTLNALELLAVLRVDQKERWQRGLYVRVEDYLQRQPALATDEELVLDLIQSEILLREERGE